MSVLWGKQRWQVAENKHSVDSDGKLWGLRERNEDFDTIKWRIDEVTLDACRTCAIVQNSEVDISKYVYNLQQN